MGSLTIPAGSNVGILSAIANGSIAKGAPVSINTDGTVSTTGYSGSTPVVYGTPVSELNTAYVTASMASAVDPISGTTVLAYTNSAGQGEAVVVTPGLGTNATFGTPVIFDTNSVCNQFSVIFDTVNSKFVIAYKLNTVGMKAIVGTVTGSTISFGSATVIEAATINSSSACFDSTNGKIIVSYGVFVSTVRAAVGTVSGTSISFGTIAIVEATTSLYGENAISFNASVGKVLIFFGDSATFGYCIVGTVSGTTISFGTRVGILGGGYAQLNSVYDVANQKNILVLAGGYIKAFSISGTVPTLFASGTTGMSYPYGIAFDVTNNKTIINCINGVNSRVQYVTLSGSTFTASAITTYFVSSSATVFSATYNSKFGKVMLFDGIASAANYVTIGAGSNNSKFIGFAGNDAGNGATETVNTIGGTNGYQTGLNTGNSYFVQIDGTLSTTQGTSGVYVGIATAATTILVRS
jgi:hypothetical protein